MHESSLPREFSGGRLRRLRAADREAFQAYRAIPELGRYQGWSPMAEAEALEFLVQMGLAPLFAPGAWVQLGIAEPQSDSLVGDIGLYLSEDGSTGKVGFTLDPSRQGRGIAFRAVREALDLLFAATEIDSVLGITDERNLPSIRLLERLGFKYRERRHVVFKAEPCVERVYALPRGDGSPFAPVSGRMNIRLARLADAARIADLVRSLEAVLVEDPAAAAPFWESLSRRAHEENIASERFSYCVAELEGALVGYIAMRDDTHLFNLFVDRPCQGRGFGRSLWQHAAARMPAHAWHRRVTVNASLNAVPVYQAFGFKAAGEVVRQHGIAFLPMSWERQQDAS